MRRDADSQEKLFFRGKLRASTKLAFLPECPEDPGDFVFRKPRLCAPHLNVDLCFGAELGPADGERRDGGKQGEYRTDQTNRCEPFHDSRLPVPYTLGWV